MARRKIHQYQCYKENIERIVLARFSIPGGLEMHPTHVWAFVIYELYMIKMCQWIK
jgi:hypothetical protein